MPTLLTGMMTCRTFLQITEKLGYYDETFGNCKDAKSTHLMKTECLDFNPTIFF